MKTDSQEYKDLMVKQSEESFREEVMTDYDTYLENEDAHGRLPVKAPLVLTNYPDSKCTWGYMTLCDKCKSKAPRHVDIEHPIDPLKEYLPSDRCEICGRRGVITKGGFDHDERGTPGSTQ